MAHRQVHYEAAFEDYLRAKGWPYVAVDEAKKAVFAGASIKSFDFLVYSSSGPNLLVDVKGRKFPERLVGRKGSGRAWENWVTRADVEGLGEWQKVFGAGFVGVFVFTYWLQGPVHHAPFQDVHVFHQRNYAFMAVTLERYVAAARPRSRKWETIAMPSAAFAEAARDVAALL